MKLPKPIESTHRVTLIKQLRCEQHVRCIGTGAYAQVFGNKTSKHVIKIGPLKDVYLKYVSVVGIKNPNPYFPKIYSIKLYKYRDNVCHWDNDDYYVVTMEKLFKWSQVPRATRERLLKKIGCDGVCDAGDPQIINSSRKWEKKAIKGLEKVWSHGMKDIHTGNIMFRKVGRGYQLVYTDPVA